MSASPPNRLVAPWSPELVDVLNTYQRRGVMHSFTCGVDSRHGDGRLLATVDGWVCMEVGCTYQQNWTHLFMADPFMATPAATGLEGAAQEHPAGEA